MSNRSDYGYDCVENILTLMAQGLNTFTLSSAIMEPFFNVPVTIEATEAFEQVAHFLQFWFSLRSLPNPVSAD